MPTQSSSAVHSVPSKENPVRVQLRNGQERLVKDLYADILDQLYTVQWPGGYGKSLGIALAYEARRCLGQVDRLLIIVANDTQRNQIITDFATDCQVCRVKIIDDEVWRFSNEAVTQRMSKDGLAEVYVTTIQTVSAAARGQLNLLIQLLRDGHKWMLACDEYHHYAETKDWGVSLENLRSFAAFTLALSATPDRDNESTIFGAPDNVVTYREGVLEGSLKHVLVRSYHYAVDAITEGEPVKFSTDELREMAGNAAGINQYEAKTGLRYTAKYIHPVLSQPLIRLNARRNATGISLQMLVRAMSCSHAQALAKQIRGMTDLSMDWIGTGPNGRTDEDNRSIKEMFCPSKDKSTGLRPAPTLDVLVQVGMAGEGFDSINVAEVVDLSLVKCEGTANETKQFYLRGARWVASPNGDAIPLYVNIPSDHPVSRFSGSNSIMDWLSECTSIEEINVEPSEATLVSETPLADTGVWGTEAGIGTTPGGKLPERADSENGLNTSPTNEWRDLPAITSNFEILDANLINITADEMQVYRQQAQENLQALGHIINLSDPAQLAAIDAAIRARKQVKDTEDQKELTLSQLRTKLDADVGTLTGTLLRRLRPNNLVESGLARDVKRNINTHLKTEYGSRDNRTIDELKNIKRYLAEWDQYLRNGGGVPSWAL